MLDSACVIFVPFKESVMSGHSKWSTIKRKKGAQDAKRGKLFGRLSKEISISVREGGSADPAANPRLRLALQNARSANMPKGNIDKALRKGQGSDGNNYQHVVYEGYAPAGVAVYVECMTDNLNRTLSQVRHLFSKHGGSLTTSGALDFLFARKGFFIVDVLNIEAQEETVLSLIEAGVEEILPEGEQSLFICAFEAFGQLQKEIEALQLPIQEANLQRVPHTLQEVTTEEAARVQRLLTALEDDDDTQRVFHNLGEPKDKKDTNTGHPN